MLMLTTLNFIAMVLFCLAMSKHREQVLEQSIPSQLAMFFRPSAWVLLIFTVFFSVQQYGWSIGPALYFGSLSVAILMVILLLTYQVKKVPQLAIILSLAAGITIFGS